MMRAEDVLSENQTSVGFGGIPVRKGTVAAFVANARTWADPSIGSSERETVERDIREAVPALRAVGLFDVLMLRDSKLERFVASC